MFFFSARLGTPPQSLTASSPLKKWDGWFRRSGFLLGRRLEGNKGCMKQTGEFRNQNLRGHAAGKLIGGKGMTVVSGLQVW